MGVREREEREREGQSKLYNYTAKLSTFLILTLIMSSQWHAYNNNIKPLPRVLRHEHCSSNVHSRRAFIDNDSIPRQILIDLATKKTLIDQTAKKWLIHMHSKKIICHEIKYANLTML